MSKISALKQRTEEPQKAPEISLQQLSHRYGSETVALRDVTCVVGQGVCGLLGPNGAGKTTLMRILATLLPPSAGAACLGPFNVADRQDRREIRNRLGYVPQGDPLYGHLNGREYLEYMAVARRVGPGPKRRAEVERVIEVMGMRTFAHRRIRTYSGGMKRRVALAQALLGTPQYLIADEPMAGLDPQERLRFRSLIGALGQECTVLVASHILEDLAHMCDRILVLRHGQLIYDGAPGRLAAVAQGFVWELAGHLPYRADSLVLREGRPGFSHRLLRPAPPHAEAQAVASTLEDGYFWLMHEREPH